MGRNPDLSEVEKLFKKGKSFSLTDAQYEKKTGRMLPKGKSYLKSSSAVSRMARENGFNVDVLEKTIVFTKEKKK